MKDYVCVLSDGRKLNYLDKVLEFEVTNLAKSRYQYIRKLLDDTDGGMTDLHGIFYSTKAVKYVDALNEPYHLNPYMDLSTCSILMAIEDSKNFIDSIRSFFGKESDADLCDEYSYSWACNYLAVLNRR